MNKRTNQVRTNGINQKCKCEILANESVVAAADDDDDGGDGGGI